MENSKISNCQSKRIFVMVGIPASGKSTWAKSQVEEKGGKYVSRDKIRYGLVGDCEKDLYFSKETQVFRDFCQEILEGLEEGKDVYADATHINKASRAKLMNHIGATVGLLEVEVVAVYVETSLETCLKRNEERDGFAKVPEDAMRSMYRFKSKPKLEENYFDKILNIKGE